MRAWCSIVLFCFSVSVNTLAQPKAEQRLTIGWKFLKGNIGNPWEAVRPVTAGSPESVPVWQDVTLPHCFNEFDAVDPDTHYYQGQGWYKTFLKIENPWEGGRTLLHFEGAGQKTEVYVYLTKVGEHVGGYDEWTVDITDAINDFRKTETFASRFKELIPVIIRCDNSRDAELIPSDMSDFNLYGGIYRHLNLVYVPALSIEKVKANAQVTRDGSEATVQVQTRFYNPGKERDATISIRLFDPKGKLYGQRETKIEDTMDHEGNLIIKKPLLWSPEQPHLYTLEVQISSSSGTHTHQEKIGFRSFSFEKNGPFILNGKRLLLRGTHRHEDHAGVAAALTDDVVRKEMVMMKEMGVNFIRLGHYQQSRRVLDLCDSLGFLVWEEIPWCRGGLGGDVYKQQARRMLTNMIEQHFNHPSVIIWGLGNENDWPGDFPEFDKQAIRSFMKELNDISHSLDPSRRTAIRRCAFCKDIVDVYSPSIWAGWYRGRYTEYKHESEKEFREVNHFLHVEWGGDSHARRHSEDPEKILRNVPTGRGTDERSGDASPKGGAVRVSKDGDWSETYVCNLIDWHLKEQETMSWLTGTAYWPFKDFSTPLRPDNPVPYMNQKGVVERDLTPKESYYVFQSYWTDKPMVHIYGHTWPVRWGEQEEEKMVKVYSNCETAELFVNGQSYGVKKRNSQDFPAAGLRWMVRFSEGMNTIRVVATKGKVIVEDEIIQHYQTEKWSEPAKLIVEQVRNEGGVVTVQAKLVDDRNVPCLDATNWIHFSLAGDGKLIDNMGTSSASRKIQAYNGRAEIRFESNGGKNIICVQSPGISTVFLDFNGKKVTTKNY